MSYQYVVGWPVDTGQHVDRLRGEIPPVSRPLHRPSRPARGLDALTGVVVVQEDEVAAGEAHKARAALAWKRLMVVYGDVLTSRQTRFFH